MKIPDNLQYTGHDEWVRTEGNTLVVGISDFAQDQLGELVHAELPEVGSTTSANQPYAELDSVKASSDVFAPLSGEVTEVNDALGEDPELLNNDPYGEGWIAKIKLSDPSEVESLLDVDAYKKLLEG